MYLRDQWYVAALSHELEQRPLSRQILGEHIALFRTESGDVVALADQCAHRGYPLSLGTVVGEVLVCGYHGFTYDCGGTCVAVPGQDRIPSKADVRSFHVIEKGLWVWIWMGRGEPDHQKLPETPWLQESDEWSSVAGVAKIDAPFHLLVDNLLDLSHETYLHNGSIGTPEVATTPIEVEVDDENRVVRVFRHMNDVECPPFYSRTTGLQGKVDRWQDIDYFPPGYYLLHARIAPVSQPPLPDGNDDHAFHMKILYGLTPSTETSVYDFWALSRDFCVGDDEIDRFLEKMQAGVVQEDVDALTILQRRSEGTLEVNEVSIKIDRGGLAARRMLMAMYDESAR
ncbi:MAG: aromatic ring-hydroxylating dioxygenase subunit alpha [Acidimicrobiales bacterium]|jgi:vanillate O-demethylase monooxygenase subunit